MGEVYYYLVSLTQNFDNTWNNKGQFSLAFLWCHPLLYTVIFSIFLIVILSLRYFVYRKAGAKATGRSEKYFFISSIKPFPFTKIKSGRTPFLYSIWIGCKYQCIFIYDSLCILMFFLFVFMGWVFMGASPCGAEGLGLRLHPILRVWILPKYILSHSSDWMGF